MGARRHIRIGEPRTTTSAGVTRVTAEVDGTPVWFETADLTARPSPEAFASAFLIPALAHGARVVSDVPLDPTWLAGSRRLVEIFHRWWGYPRLAPEGPAASTARPPAVQPSARARGLFFSGGVDSFHSLLCCGEHVGLLVFVHGFDIPIADVPRAESTLASVRTVAAACAVGAGAVRTDLREHPLMRAAPWERTNGGAMAAVGHVIADTVDEMLIASSITVGHDQVWGSHWDTDPLFSSDRVRFREVGQALRRMEKLQAIADEALPRHHLRVCWENRAPSGNCSRCGKCVITRLVLADRGVLDEFAVFAGTDSLAADLDALTSDRRLQTLAQMSGSTRLPVGVREAARRLFDRSRHAASLPVRARRALLKTVLRWVPARRRTPR